MKMTFNKIKPAAFTLPLATLLFATATVTSHAHPGHELSESSASHIATSPYHLIVGALILLISAGLASTIWFSKKRRSEQPAVIRK